LSYNIQEEKGSEKSLIFLMSFNLTSVFDLIKKLIIFLTEVCFKKRNENVFLQKLTLKIANKRGSMIQIRES
jgi:hypothetical protein